MTRRCSNYIRLDCPAHEQEALHQALAGPAEPWFPEEAYRPDLLGQIESAHHRIELEQLRSEAQSAYARLRGCPDWYRVSLGDILIYQRDPTLSISPKTETLPISLPRHRPILSEREMNAWLSDPQGFHETAYGFRSALGLKSPGWHYLPRTSSRARSQVVMQSAWLRPSDPIRLLLAPLHQHRARMLWLSHLHGDDELSGWWFDGNKIVEFLEISDSISKQDQGFSGLDYVSTDCPAVEAKLLELGIPAEMCGKIFF